MKPKRPSRLELYLEILNSLDQLQVANAITIQEKAKVGRAFFKHAMDFLEKQDFILKENVEGETVYRITARGDRVSRYFSVQAKETNMAMPNEACAETD